MPANLENSAVATGLEKISFYSNAKERSNYRTIALISHASKVMLNKSRLPLFRQGGATVGLTTRLSAERDQGGSIFAGRLVEAIRETLIRWDVLGIF